MNLTDFTSSITQWLMYRQFDQPRVDEVWNE